MSEEPHLDERDGSERQRRAWPLPLAIVLLGSTLTVLATVAVRADVESERVESTMSIAQEVRRSVQRSVTRAETLLHSVRGLFHASQEVTADEFAVFVATEELERRAPGIDAVFAALADADGSLHIRFSEGADEAQQLADRPLAATVGKPSLEALQRTAGPVVANSLDAPDLAIERAASLVLLLELESVGALGVAGVTPPGVVGVVVDPATVIAETQELLPGAEVVVRDLGPTDDQVPLEQADVLVDTSPTRSAPLPDERADVEQLELPVGDHTWCIQIRATIDPRSLLVQRLPWLVGFAGMAATFGAAAWTLVASRARAGAERTAERLAAAEQAKTAFLANVSHELRTPLAAIIGITEILERRDELPTDQREQLLGRVQRNGHELLGMVERILDHTHLAAGEALGPTTAVHVATVASDAVEASSPLLDDHTVNVDIPDDLVARCDGRGLLRVLTNLLSNAAKFSGVGTTIDVDAHLAHDRIVISVRDEGIGIPEGDRARVLEPFERSAEAPPGRRGTGLGLAVVRRFVEQHGGRTVLVSHAAGTTISFDLPADSATNGGRELAS